MKRLVRTAARWMGTAGWAGGLVLAAGFASMAGARAPGRGPEPKAAQATTATAPGVPFSADKLATLLPATVYFAGRTAPLQLRNAGGTQFGNGSIFWICLVDSSGYSSSVQERYQFYLVTEGTVRFGDLELRPGAYGGGFVGDRFVLMDIGDHTVGEGATQTDPELRRPRPLQVVADQSNAVKLYLGRRRVAVRSISH